MVHADRREKRWVTHFLASAGVVKAAPIMSTFGWWLNLGLIHRHAAQPNTTATLEATPITTRHSPFIRIGYGNLSYRYEFYYGYHQYFSQMDTYGIQNTRDFVRLERMTPRKYGKPNVPNKPVWISRDVIQ